MAAGTAALPALIANLAVEVAPIRVNLIAAGFVDTPLSASLLGDDLDQRRDQLRATLPIGRVVGPADIAALAVHIMTNTALTGATYDIDGGQQLVPERARSESPAESRPDPRLSACGEASHGIPGHHDHPCPGRDAGRRRSGKSAPARPAIRANSRRRGTCSGCGGRHCGPGEWRTLGLFAAADGGGSSRSWPRCRCGCGAPTR